MRVILLFSCLPSRNEEVVHSFIKKKMFQLSTYSESDTVLGKKEISVEQIAKIS